MNLALHGFLLQVILLSVINLQHGSLLCSAGEPGYLDFDNLPETNFSCQGKVIGGYYADVEAGCQMFHVCTIGQKDEIMDIKFLCLNGTVFDQETRVCERVDEVDCSKSERFYNLNLELYGNNAVTLSLHENSEDELDQSEPIEDHQRSTSARPTTTTTTTTTTSKPSTTPSSNSFSHQTGYPQPFQPQPPFHTSQSKSLYDDKNGGYHHQYIFHNGERNNNNQQATSYQLFSNQGVSTTVQPQVHQIRYSSTPSSQIIHNEPSTVAPLFHSSSTIQTLLNSNGNGPSLINPIFHNHGIASTTEQFSIHSNNPRETSEYRENAEEVRTLETSKAKVSISSAPESTRSVQTKTSSSSQQQRISGNFLPTPSTDETTVRSFYPTPRASPKTPQASQSTSEQVTQHIHVLPPVQIPQLKPHQVTINIPPSDIQRIVQNPSSLLPSQSRVIVTAKASVSDESGRPLNTSQLVTLPLPTIPASYDDYKEGDESFDPFYRDVPKIRNGRRVLRDGRDSRWDRNEDLINSFSEDVLRDMRSRLRRSVGQSKSSIVTFYNGDKDQSDRVNDKKKVALESSDFQSLKESLIKFRDILFGSEFTDDVIRSVFDGSKLDLGEDSKSSGKNSKDDLIQSVFEGSKLDLGEDSKSSGKNSKDDLIQSIFEGSKLDLGEDSKSSGKNSKDDLIQSIFEGSKLDLGEDSKSSGKNSKDDLIQSIFEGSKLDFGKDSKSSGKNSKRDLIDDQSRASKNLKLRNNESEGVRGNKTESEEDSKSNTKDSEEYINLDGNFKDQPKSVQSKNDKNESDSNSGKDVSDIDVVILDPNEYLKMQSNDEKYSSTTIKILTEPPTVSTTEQTTTTTTINKQNSSRYSRKHNVEQKNSKGEKKEEKTLETRDERPHTRRRSSRIRSRGKLTSRRRVNDEDIKPSTEKTVQEKIEASTETVKSESERIDKNIFDEPESQTSKEVDTRAVSDRNSYLKKQEGKETDLGKENRKGGDNEYETLKGEVKGAGDSDKDLKNDNATNLDFEIKSEKIDESKEGSVNETKDEESIKETEGGGIEIQGDEDKSDKKNEERDNMKGTDLEINTKEAEGDSVKDKSIEETQTEAIVKDENIKENDEKLKKENSEDLEDHLTQEKHYYQEKSSVEHETIEDVSTTVFGGENSEEDSQEIVKSSRKKYKNSSKEVVSYKEEKTKKLNDEGEEESEESQEYSTIKSEEINSEEFSTEYQESTEAFYASTYEDPEEEYTSLEDTTLSSERFQSEEEDESSLSDQEESTEGVLKFTDELPKEKKEDTSESRKSSESNEGMVHDYVDDNYEPDNYKERESSDSNSLSDEKINKEMMADGRIEKPEEKSTSGKNETNETPKSVRVRTTTTTVRPVPPKLFKPIAARKNYNYFPPTTTPNPVVIKPRLSLLNPKPAKPPKSYNELVPKPVIRKFPLLSRKPTTTVPTTTKDEGLTETTELITTEAITTTEASRSEENVLEGKSESVNDSQLVINSDSVHESLLKPVNHSGQEYQLEIKSDDKSNDSEHDQLKEKLSDNSENNDNMKPDSKDSDKKLINDKNSESGQEIKSQTESEHKNLDSEQAPPIRTDDQDTSPNEQKTSTNTEKAESFTPYPISKLVSNIEKAFKEAASTESEASTTVKSFTLMDVELISTTIPPTTLTTTDQSTESSTVKASTEPETTQTPATSFTKTTDKVTVSPVAPSTEITPTTEETVKKPSGNRKSTTSRRYGGFNCLEREMYRFYGDDRDCRLFHYCSPGFTSRQVLDFRFVCEEGTTFDEETQSCRHDDVKNRRCANRRW